MDNRPIGMFDSGVGGLTVYKEVKKQLPNESIVYLGDTKRFPYGSKSKESIIELTKQGIDFLIRQNVKLIVIACGTATSQALEEVKNLYSVPIIGIIDSTVEYLEEKYRNNKNAEIGIIATAGTIKSNGWQNKIKEYLIEMKKIDTLILGCTHYPLFQKIIKKEMGKRVEIINTGEKIARKLTTYLQENNIQNVEEMIEDKIYLTDTECNFVSVAEKLLGDNKIGEKIQKAEYLQITT